MKLFTVRPRPRPGECLSGYFLRIAEANLVNYLDIRKKINIGSTSYFNSAAMYKVDSSLQLINFKIFALSLHLEEKIIKDLTFLPILDKFFDNPSQEERRFRSFLNSLIVTDVRRFCSHCVRENRYFKLIWQIREIKICLEHQVDLKSNCCNCNQPLPYFYDHMNELVCNSCGNSIYSECEIKNAQNEEFIKKQFQVIYDWRFLLNSELFLTSKLERFTLEQSLAIKLLYISQNKATTFNKLDIKLFSPVVVQSLVALIRNGKSTKRVLLSDLFKLTDHYGMNLKEFSAIEVSTVYIASINLVSDHLDLAPSFCCTPWCHSYGKDTAMKHINVRKKGANNIYFKQVHVCIDCYLYYGYYQKEWREIKGDIELFMDVKELVRQGISRRNITSTLKIDYHRTSLIIAYLLRFFLLDTKQFELVRNVSDSKLSILFDSIIEEYWESPETIYYKAKERYGWGVIEFYYYFFDSAVQNIYLFRTQTSRTKISKKREQVNSEVDNKLKDMINNNRTVTVKKVAASLKVGRTTINSPKYAKIKEEITEEKKKQRLAVKEQQIHFYLTVFEEYKQMQNDLGRPLRCDELYKHLGVNQAYICKYHYEIQMFFSEKVEESKELFLQKKVIELSSKVRNIIPIIHKEQGRLSQSLIGKYLGFSYMNRKSRFYSLLISVIKDEIDKFLLKRTNEY
ncbi:TniQ family protein [Paenibacillus sp. LjRoot153]|uniref:TniQ family protein n=1 Tax=Paenibacillus sp. LjRoot153 TaxID=3342270 RepID=UPI003ED0B5BA